MKKIEIRVFLYHYWKQGFNATAAARKIREVEDDDVAPVHTAPDSFKKFNDGETGLRDKPRSG